MMYSRSRVAHSDTVWPSVIHLIHFYIKALKWTYTVNFLWNCIRVLSVIVMCGVTAAAAAASEWLVPRRLGFRVTDAPASASAFLSASRPLIPPNGGCHLAANLNAPTMQLPHLAKLISVRRAPYPTASCLVLGALGPGGPRHPPTQQQHLSIISPWLY